MASWNLRVGTVKAKLLRGEDVTDMYMYVKPMSYSSIQVGTHRCLVLSVHRCVHTGSKPGHLMLGSRCGWAFMALA